MRITARLCDEFVVPTDRPDEEVNARRKYAEQDAAWTVLSRMIDGYAYDVTKKWTTCEKGMGPTPAMEHRLEVVVVCPNAEAYDAMTRQPNAESAA